MDVSAYLKKQGWRGAGHSLDHTDRGIKKPLQVSKKVDALGVGLQKHAAVSDQWWLRAYDQGLKDLGTGKESTLAAAQKHGVNRGGLYARFVKGTAVPGTIGQQAVQDDASAAMARPNPKPYSQPLDATENFVPDQSIARKRQLKESAAEVRARRRAERIQREKDNTARKLSRAGFNTGAVERPKSELDHIRHRVKGFVDEAMRRGVIAPRRTTKPVRTRAVAPNTQDMDAVLELAQLPPWKAKTSPKAEKIQREKMIRDLKRAVIKYLENTTVSSKELEAAKNAEEKFKQQRKESREAHRENVKLEKERRVEAKKERRLKKEATLLAVKRRAMGAANGDADGFTLSADEIRGRKAA